MSELAHESTSRTTCFVLAGGSGQRLRPLTVSVPKPLLQFGGVHCLLDFTLSNVVTSSLGQTYVLTQYLAESVGAYLRKWRHSLRRGSGEISHQPPTSGKRYRSTADAVAQNMDLVPKESDLILVLSADHVYHMDYRRLIARHIQQGAGLTVSAVPVPLVEARELGVLSIDCGGGIVDFAEKPDRPNAVPGMDGHALSSMGVYVFDRALLEEAMADLHLRVPGPDFGRDVIPYCVERAEACAWIANDTDQTPIYWRDVGTLQGYYDANMDSLADPGLVPLATGWPSPSDSRAPAAVPSQPSIASILAPSAVLGDCRIEGSILSPGASVDDGAEVSDSILLPGARVGRGATVRNAIIDASAAVAAGDQIGCRREQDRERFNVTDGGIVVVPARGLQPIPSRAAFAEFESRHHRSNHNLLSL